MSEFDKSIKIEFQKNPDNYEKDVNEVLKSFPHLKAYCSKILSNYASVNFEYLQDLSSNEIAKAKNIELRKIIEKYG